MATQTVLPRSLGGPLLLTTAILLVLSPSSPAQTPPVAVPKAVAPHSDLELVERLLAARRDYQGTLEQLRTFYTSAGDTEKTRWAEEELRQFHRIPKQAYNLELDVPPPTLQASQNVYDANELYRRAMQYKDKGWGNDYVDNQRRAEILLQQLLTTYPNSNKIGDAAYQLGDLYEGRTYKQYHRAVQYFERSYQWNSTTTSDARLRAARLYDRNLMERSKAVELYKQVVAHDSDAKRVQEAQKRLTDLSAK